MFLPVIQYYLIKSVMNTRTIKVQPLMLFAINGIFIGGLTLDLQNVSYVELQYEDIPACGRIYFAAFNVDEKMREFYSVDKFQCLFILLYWKSFIRF